MGTGLDKSVPWFCLGTWGIHKVSPWTSVLFTNCISSQSLTLYASCFSVVVFCSRESGSGRYIFPFARKHRHKPGDQRHKCKSKTFNWPLPDSWVFLSLTQSPWLFCPRLLPFTYIYTITPIQMTICLFVNFDYEQNCSFERILKIESKFSNTVYNGLQRQNPLNLHSLIKLNPLKNMRRLLILVVSSDPILSWEPLSNTLQTLYKID